MEGSGDAESRLYKSQVELLLGFNHWPHYKDRKVNRSRVSPNDTYIPVATLGRNNCIVSIKRQGAK